ncbi:hypothetical protein ACJIZ3_009418 [Penstemon smallii]|uniref:DYW domain-containing protein n=1 Tax=Penstemon smallii TaxID=265156 RepID=A0ABD3TEF3_9LAMI
MAEAGYVPNISTAFFDVDIDEKMEMVKVLTIAFGLVSTLPGTKFVKKNLCVCEDSLNVIVRDVNRYHRFKDDACSFGEWILIKNIDEMS